MINLFEFQNKEYFKDKNHNLENFLDDIWKNREKSDFYSNRNLKGVESQKFINFLYKTGEIKSNKYVGVIHFEDQKINLLPKLFYDEDKSYNDSDITAIQNHILWWLSYCKKIKFPNYQTSLGSSKSNFFEVLIYLFSKYTRELLSNSIYQQYEDINRELPYIKGRLNSTAYINENISRGRWHKINCTYDSFIFDNKFNQIIKYVTSLLLNVTTSSDNKKYLREILFILDNVSDTIVSAEECKNLQFNPMFEDFETVRDYCYLFLNNSVSFNYKNNLKLFAFLLPMEYIFEDFIFGFIDRELSNIKVKAQVTNKYLDTEQRFALRPDLYLEVGDKKIIADTKYKIIYSNDKDPKNGISQNDLYQMLAYAVRFKINDIILFYPDTIKNYQKDGSIITIKDELAEDMKVTIKSYQLPIINSQLFIEKNIKESNLTDIFTDVKVQLIKRLEDILR